MDIILILLFFIFNREKEQETQKEERLMEEKKKKKQEEKKKKEGAQKKVWLELLCHCLYNHYVSRLHHHSHYITKFCFIAFKNQYAKSIISKK